MAHKSRLGCIVIDCQMDALDEAVAFWSGALGVPGKIDEDGKYAVLQAAGDEVRMLIQAVDHPPRVHLDIETDDKPAERDRLVTLGAREIGSVKNWIVMEAPTGHRFCVVDPQRGKFADVAQTWDQA